ncbi:MAG: hypothetical protein V3T41_00980 [bacterium]
MKRIITLTTAVTVAALALTCCDKTVINGEIPPPEPTSPANILKSVEISFNQRDIDLLKRALSPNFVFYANPGEIGRPRPEGTPYRLPLSYSFTEFWHIAYNMFNSAYAINLSISIGGAGEPGPEESTFRTGDVNVSLLVMVDETSGYMAEGYCYFEFEKYKNEQGRDRWRLTNWWDNTEGGGEGPAGVEHVPLWYILSMYEKPT